MVAYVIEFLKISCQTPYCNAFTTLSSSSHIGYKNTKQKFTYSMPYNFNLKKIEQSLSQNSLYALHVSSVSNFTGLVISKCIYLHPASTDSIWSDTLLHNKRRKFILKKIGGMLPEQYQCWWHGAAHQGKQDNQVTPTPDKKWHSLDLGLSARCEFPKWLIVNKVSQVEKQ